MQCMNYYGAKDTRDMLGRIYILMFKFFKKSSIAWRFAIPSRIFFYFKEADNARNHLTNYLLYPRANGRKPGARVTNSARLFTPG